MQEWIKAENLAIGHLGKVVAKDIHFTFYEQDYLCIIGENGAGKTTLMETILGLHKPIAGNISFLKKGIHFGWLPQQKEAQKDFPATVYEVVASGIRHQGLLPFLSAAEKERIMTSMHQMDICHLMHRSYQRLSGGQQQRVLLARALCAKEGVLMIDEPTASLDQETTSELYQLLHTLNAQGIAIMMVTHDVDVSLAYAKHVLVMDEHPRFMSKAEYDRENGV